jgi:glycosyltransferase involved in cell wall biosynthesis
MKIAFIIPSLEYGLRYWRYFFEELVVSNNEITVLTAHFTSENIPKESKIKVINLNGSNKWINKETSFVLLKRWFSPLLMHGLKKEKPDFIVCIEFSIATFWALLYGKIMKVPTAVFKEHCTRPDLAPGFLKKNWLRLIIILTDHVIANTEEAGVELSKLIKTPIGKLSCFPLLVPPIVKELCQIPLQLPRNFKKPVFVYIGRLIEGKNVDAIIKAAMILAEKGHAFSVWIVGDGEKRAELEKKTKLHNLDDLITFWGDVRYESIGYLLRDANIFIMPTFNDYRSVSVLEAMRFGLPIIDSYGDGNARNLVKHGINGFLFDPADYQQLSQVMEECIMDPKKLKKMGFRSARDIKEYNNTKAASDLLALARSLI